jgi:hypothetical protein
MRKSLSDPTTAVLIDGARFKPIEALPRVADLPTDDRPEGLGLMNLKLDNIKLIRQVWGQGFKAVKVGMAVRQAARTEAMRHFRDRVNEPVDWEKLGKRDARLSNAWKQRLDAWLKQRDPPELAPHTPAPQPVEVP